MTANKSLVENIEVVSREQGNASSKEELEEMKQQAVFMNFAMTRVTFLRDAKFANIGKLFKKVTFAKEKRVLALRLSTEDKYSNHRRLETFKHLYSLFKNDFTFLLVDDQEETAALVDLFPHIDADLP